MARYSSATTVDLSLPGGLSQAGPSPDSQQPRYAALDVFFSFFLVKYGRLATGYVVHLSTFSTIIPFLAYSLSLGRLF
jgi:hypothetical protein